MTVFIALTFHAIHSEERYSIEREDPRAKRYAVSKELLQQSLARISPNECSTVSEVLYRKEGDHIVLTFDDGYISDFEIVFPLLLERNVKGTFYVTARNIGKPGYVSFQQLRNMADAGMEIGSHGLSHQYLVSMPRSQTIEEMAKSKEILEQEVGLKIESFAPVGGHFHKWMLECAREIGYKVFATMVPGRTFGGKDFIKMRRNHIQAGHDFNYIYAVMNGSARIFFLNRVKYDVLRLARAALGMKRYDKVREFILRAFT